MTWAEFTGSSNCTQPNLLLSPINVAEDSDYFLIFISMSHDMSSLQILLILGGKETSTFVMSLLGFCQPESNESDPFSK